MNWEAYQKDFLWFTYFGITPDKAKNKDLALNACIKRAYRDLSRTIDYKYSVSDLNNTKKVSKDQKNKFKNYKDTWKRNAEDSIKKWINELLGEDDITPQDFDNRHESICKYLKKKDPELFKITSGFSYGQAQKWINMTLKYMLIMGIWNNEMSTKIQFLHIPIDNIVLKVLYNISKDESKIKKISESEFLIVGKKGNFKWSAIPDNEEYDIFRQYIEKVINDNPITDCNSFIEWESKKWLDQSMN